MKIISPFPQPLVAQYVAQSSSHLLSSAGAILSGCALVAALAQIAVPLSFTPVPITGQTFGVALLGLLWGRSLSFGALLFYVAAGCAGIPIFAGGGTFLNFGPTSGYLLGMPLAALCVGTLADRGWTRSFCKTWMAASLGSVIIFSCGAIVLGLYVPFRDVFVLGILPFLPGDLIKNSLASLIAFHATRKYQEKK